MKRIAALRSLLCIAPTLGLVACITPPPPPLGGPVTVTTLDADEQALWKESRELQYKIEVSGLHFEDAEVDRYLARVLERVTPPALREASLEPRVEVISNVNLHGYSFANGVVYLHTALLSILEDETQLAIVLSRELAHVAGRHALHAKRQQRLQADSLAWIGVGSTLVDGGGEAKLLIQAAALTSAAGFHHSLETAADAKGLAALDRAGYAVSGTPALYESTLEYLAEVHKQGVWGWAPFTPPLPVTARITGLKTLIANEYADQAAARPPVLDPSAFARALYPAMLRQSELELASGLFVSAESTARRATKARPDDTRGWVLLGRALQGQRTKPVQGLAVPRLRDVRAAFGQALQLDSRHAEATRELGMTFYRKRGTARSQEDAKEARRHFRRYLRLAPRADDRDYVRGYLDELDQEVR